MPRKPLLDLPNHLEYPTGWTSRVSTQKPRSSDKHSSVTCTDSSVTGAGPAAVAGLLTAITTDVPLCNMGNWVTPPSPPTGFSSLFAAIWRFPTPPTSFKTFSARKLSGNMRCWDVLTPQSPKGETSRRWGRTDSYTGRQRVARWRGYPWWIAWWRRQSSQK